MGSASRNPRVEAARVLNRAAEGGAFDEFLREEVSSIRWLSREGDAIRAKARSLVGEQPAMEFRRVWVQDDGPGKYTIEFTVSGFDGSEET